MADYQQGFLRREKRLKGSDVWVLRYYAGNELTGRKTERNIRVGTVADFPKKALALREVERLALREKINKPGIKSSPTVAELAQHYIEHRLCEDQSRCSVPLSHTTISAYKRTLKLRIIPRWGTRDAATVKPTEIEAWLVALRCDIGLANQTLTKCRYVFKLVYDHAYRHELLKGNKFDNPLLLVEQQTTSDFVPMTIQPQEAYRLWQELPQMEGLLVLLATYTGVRMSEALGLRWGDVDFENAQIFIRRAWAASKIGPTKTKASNAPVAMHPKLAEFMLAWRRETPYAADEDYVFASTRLKGKQPRSASIMIENYIRPAAVTVGILTADDPRRFGLHTMRHSLATFLSTGDTKSAVVKSMMRHSNFSTTADVYIHPDKASKLAAQELISAQLFPEPPPESPRESQP